MVAWHMGKCRVRPETGTLYLDFFYRQYRCREQTTLPDTVENRTKIEALLKRIEKEIRRGTFDFCATFPGSPRAARFAVDADAPPVASVPQIPGPGSVAQREAIPRFDEFSVTWRAEMSPQWRRLHRSGVDDIFKKHLLPAFGERGLDEIAKADVLTFRADLAKLRGRAGKSMSPSRINKIMCILRQLLNEAADRFQLPPAFRGIKPLKARRPDVLPFSMEEVERIRTTIRADYRDYVTVRFFTGMRTGEINGLKWQHVDRERGLILVRETFTDGESEQNAKNETSLRDIPMLPVVREAIEARWQQRAPGSTFVFCSVNDTPIDAHNFANRVWYPLLRFLGIDKRRPYQTRHTTATLMLASGENPEWIAKIMGHANTQMLFTVYSRFVPNLMREDGRAFTGLINSRSALPRVDPVLTAKQIESMGADALREALKSTLLARPSHNKEITHGNA